MVCNGCPSKLVEQIDLRMISVVGNHVISSISVAYLLIFPTSLHACQSVHFMTGEGHACQGVHCSSRL